MSERCCKTVYDRTMNFPRPQRCKKTATKEHDGRWYCGTHHPDAVQARRAKSQEEYERRSAERHAQWAKQARDAKRAELFPELVEALSELWAVTPSTAPGIGLEGAIERHAAACKLAVDVLTKSKAIL